MGAWPKFNDRCWPGFTRGGLRGGDGNSTNITTEDNIIMTTEDDINLIIEE